MQNFPLLFFIITVFAFGLLLGGEQMPNPNRQWDPQGFDATSKWAKFSAYEVLDNVVWSGDEIILDVGTGDGKICAFMASKVVNGKVFGIDPSREMIAFANKNYPVEKYSNLRFEVGTAITYQPTESYDLITSFTALHLEPNQERVFQNFANWLKPTGRLLLKFPNGDGFADALEETTLLPQWSQYFEKYQSGWFFHTKEDYEKFLSDAGLQIVCIENQILDECYDTPMELANAVRFWLPHLQNLPLEKQDFFLEDLIRIFLNKVPPEPLSGMVHHYEPTLFIEALKL